MNKHSVFNHLEVLPTIDDLNIAAAEFIISTAKNAIAKRGRFIISFSGGQTPVKLYSILSQPPFSEQIEWGKTFIFWGDERCVPLEDDQNNAYQARITLLDKVDIPATNIHIIPVNLTPAKAANKYEKDINDFFGNEPRQFDLVLLGLGENGHTASLFPGTKVLKEHTEGVREVYVEDEKMFRITMTAPLINMAHHILFLVAGRNKAEILENIMWAPYQPEKYPAQLIKPVKGSLRWFADSAAATPLLLRSL
jgi:6-phosphogluconolactonase